MSPKAAYVLALDQGTTSSRAIVFGKDGSIVGTEAHEFEQLYPQPGWVEHDADEIWETQLRALRGAVNSAGIEFAEFSLARLVDAQLEHVVLLRFSVFPTDFNFY